MMMIDIKNSRFLRALARQPVDATPIWIMRQAGRYLPEYKSIRARVGSFLTLCKSPELACEVTLQPLKRFDLDAAIIFSDILIIPDAMGLGLYFESNEGPRFRCPIQGPKSVLSLPALDIDALQYVMDTIHLVKRAMPPQLPLIGFAGSPWTLAAYMVEGGSSKDFHLIKKFLFTAKTELNLLLEKLVLAVSQYLERQIAAGVDAVMLFDTWGGLLTPEDYAKFSLGPITRIVGNIKKIYPEMPIILFTKNGGQWLEMMLQSKVDALGIDWTTSIREARRRINDKVALQGNMDPAVLYGSPARIRQEVKKILKEVGGYNGHIFNLGHGIYPDIAPENVKILVDTVHELSMAFHA
jgi:uroporphyrinogen decarboxylase